jgi:broad specificity phosphatase PhoE
VREEIFKAIQVKIHSERTMTTRTEDSPCNYTLYLIRHGEAVHNVEEKEARARELEKCLAEGLDADAAETLDRMEEARMKVLEDPTLFDAPLTELGEEQTQQAGKKLKEMIDGGHLHPPTEVLVSPLRRTLRTAAIIFPSIVNIPIHVAPEIRERQTLKPPDTPHPKDDLMAMTDYKNYDMSRVLHHLESDVSVGAEDKHALRGRTQQLFDLLVLLKHHHVVLVSHKAYLRELERGPFGLSDAPEFDNAEIRVYKVIFRKGRHHLDSIKRLR